MISPHFNHLIFNACGLALLALVSACGGGGGASPPALRFDQISLGAVAAVRDNSTGLVWAAQPAVNEQSPGSSPSVQELLTLTDAGKDAIAENFPRLLLNQEIQSNESRMTLPWVVSFSPNNLGEVRNGEPLSGAPFSSLRVLDRTKFSPPRFDRDEFIRHVVWQGNLMWHLCTYGTTYDPMLDNCKGDPEAFELNQAKDLALKLSNKGYGGYYGWRLPTKEELQKMLNLSNANGSLLAAPFSGVESDTLKGWSAKNNPLEYWTSTEAPVERPDPTDPVVWVVNFDLGLDPGGVNTTNVSNVKALVRLVRNLR
jgi:hypothetical protein